MRSYVTRRLPDVAGRVQTAQAARRVEEAALKERIAARVAAAAAMPGWKEGRAADARKLDACRKAGRGMRYKEFKVRVNLLKALAERSKADMEREQVAAAARVEAGKAAGAGVSALMAALRAKKEFLEVTCGFVCVWEDGPGLPPNFLLFVK